MSSHGQGPSNSAAAVVVGVGALLVLALFGAAVALSFAGWKPESIAGLLTILGTIAGVLLAALGTLVKLVFKVDQVAQVAADAQDASTSSAVATEVQARIRREVRSALTDHGLPPRPPVPPRKR